MTRREQIQHLLEDQIELFLDVYDPTGEALNPLTYAHEHVIFKAFAAFMQNASVTAYSGALRELMGSEG